jgi:phosphocarrier protein HPr
VAVVERTVRIVNSLGLHARPAAAFVKIAGRYQSHIAVRKDETEVNGKSIMGMMMLAAECGSELLLRADGEDAEQAVGELMKLVQAGFGED